MTRRLLLAAGILAVLVVPVQAIAIAPTDGGSTTVPPTDPPVAEATKEARNMRAELRTLARAWDEGGGRFGYPFWEKAGQRWAARQITTTMYREYVTGYRDRLRAGCRLLDSADLDSSEARDVRSLALDACRGRVDALRDQRLWLDELIARDGIEGATDTDAAATDERIAELEASWREALQRSFRDARLAMDLAQQELDESGQERLPEDAFL